MTVAMLCSVLLTGCASAPPKTHKAAYDAYVERNDPLEPLNRGVWAFNDFMDYVLLEPAARGYRFITTPGIRNSVGNFLDNLDEPRNAANAVLQGEITRASDSAVRFSVNSTVGVLGLFDVAEGWGFPYRDEDFGQTLAVWGLSSGPYIMLPLLGPSNPRDMLGMVGDFFLNPFDWIERTENVDWMEPASYALRVVEVVDAREGVLEVYSQLQEQSLDFYAGLRSIYRQNRAAAIANLDDPGAAAQGPATYEFDFPEDELDAPY